MHPASDEFKAALRRSHTSITKANLLRGHTTIVEDLPVITGEVTDDASALIRRRCNLTLPGIDEVLDLLPEVQPSDGGLWPLGNELELFGGIRFPDGTEELIAMGVFRISKPVVTDSGSDVTLQVEGFDRSRSVSRAGFIDSYTVAQGTNYAEAIRTLIEQKAPWLTQDDHHYVFMETPYETPSLVFTPSDDPWDVATKMASSFGAELFFDGHGNIILRPQPDPLFTPPGFDYSEGEEATITSITRDLDDQEAYNGVVIIAENSDLPAPIRSEVWDTNPDSPTYYDPANPSTSIYGPVPKIISTQYISTQAQADDAAAAEFARIMGVIEKIDFSAINNPTHFSGDVISVARGRINVDSIYLLESIKIGLGANTQMSGTTRKRRAA